jgi:hypothetical protein
MSESVLWLRFFDHACSSIAFTTIAVVSLWLALRRFAGHRTLLCLTFVFALVRSIAHVNLTFMAFRGNLDTTPLTTICTTLSAVAGMILAIKVISSVDDLESTLTRTEARAMLKEDREKDQEQAQMLMRFMAESNRDKSSEMMSTLVAR